MALDANQAAEIMRRSQSPSGVPTSEFEQYGGYDAVKSLSAGNNTGYQYGVRTTDDMAKYAPTDTATSSYLGESGKPETMYASGNSASGGRLPITGASSSTGLTRQIDPASETIEGRIQKLLDANNPLIVQAKNRAMQQFSQRGLLDSSMASQAAQEAMTAKAIDIAGPDAKAYQTQGMLNQTESNKSSLMNQEYGLKGTLQGQSDAAALERAVVGQQTQDTSTNARLYSDGIQKINSDYAVMIKEIQMGTKMDEAQKSAAVQIQTDLRDSSILAWNQASKSLPGWSSEWAVIPTYRPAPVVATPAEAAGDAKTIGSAGEGFAKLYGGTDNP